MIGKKAKNKRPPLAALMGADAHYEGNLRFGWIRIISRH